jgi:hypothetical protein
MPMRSPPSGIPFFRVIFLMSRAAFSLIWSMPPDPELRPNQSYIIPPLAVGNQILLSLEVPGPFA